MNRLGFWICCCAISFNSLYAHPGSGSGHFIWNPYNWQQPRQPVEVLQDPWTFVRFPELVQEAERPDLLGNYFQVFMGQIPNFWTAAQLEWMLLQVTGFEVRITRMGEGHAFVLTHTEAQRDRLLELGTRLLTEANGVRVLNEAERTIYQDRVGQNARHRQGLPRLPIVIEMPRNHAMLTFLPRPTGFHGLGVTMEQFLLILLRRPGLLDQEAERLRLSMRFPPIVFRGPELLEAIRAGEVEPTLQLIDLFKQNRRLIVPPGSVD